MWLLLRVLALTVVAAVVTLAAGGDELVVRLAGRGAELVGLGPPASGPGAELGATATAVTLAAGVVLALAAPSARGVRQVVTLVHELGHTVVAAALGARPSAIVLRHDASGHATARWVGRPTPARRLALAVVAAAGTPATTVGTWAGAQLYVAAGPRPVLWSLAAAAAVVAVLARSAWSLVIAVALGGAAVATLRDAAAPWAGAIVVGGLAAVAVRAVADDVRTLRAPITAGDDARAVARQLWLPARLVRTLLVATSAVAGIATLALLTGFLGG
jgi:hypothetical protein